MGYQVVLTNRAFKQLEKLENKQRLLVSAAIDDIAESENPKNLPNAKKLQGVENGWRWRVGAYRILGTCVDDVLIIELFRIGHQRDVYQSL